MTIDTGNEPVPYDLASRYALGAARFVGTTSTLYDGRDPSSGEHVLVKVLRADLLPSAPERQRVRRELQKLTQVDHPSLVRVVEVGETEDLLWLVRPYIPGQSLSDLLSNQGPLDVRDAAWVGARLAAALGELHRLGILHRDLRPGHVLITDDGNLRVLDAAAGRTFRAPDGRLLMGTPGYVAPEAIAGKLVSFRSDLYSLGATLYECLSGSAPYTSADAAILLRQQLDRDPASLPASVPAALARLVYTLLSREPRERPFSAQQLERQLDPFALNSSPPGPEAVALDDVTEHPEAHGVVSGGAPRVRPPADDADDGPGERADEAPTRVSGAIAIPGGPAVARAPSPVRAPTQSVPGSPSGVRAAVGAPVVPAPPASSQKATLMGYVRPAPPTTSAAPAPEPVEEFDFDDVAETMINEHSRVFGVPDPSQLAMGSAVPPLPEGVARQVLTGSVPVQPPAVQMLARTPPAPAPAPPVRSFTPPPAPAVPATLAMPQSPEPGADPPGVSSTVAMEGFVAPPAWGGLAGPTPGTHPGLPQPPPGYPGYPPAPYPGPYQGVPPQGNAPYAAPPTPGMPGGYAPSGAPPGYAPHAPYHPHLPTMPPPAGYVPPQAPSRVGLVLAVAFGCLSLVVAAGAGTYALIQYRSRTTPPRPPPALTIVPPVVPPVLAPPPVVQPTPAPVVQPTAPPVVQPTLAPVVQPTPAPVVQPMPAPVVQPTLPPVVQPTLPPVVQPTAPPVVQLAPRPAVRAPAPVAVRPAVALQRRPPAPRPVVAQPAPAVRAPSGATDAQVNDALRRHDWAGARTLLTAAVHAQPNSAALHARLADVLERLGDQTHALAEYRQAARLDPRNTDVMGRLAELQLSMGDRTGAIATWRRVLAVAPHDPAATHRLEALTHPTGGASGGR